MVCAAGLWRRAEGVNEVAMGACEKLRVAASLCVLAVVEEVRVGRERALERQRVADLEAMIVVCVWDVLELLRIDLQMFSSESQSRCFALLSNDAASAVAAEDKV